MCGCARMSSRRSRLTPDPTVQPPRFGWDAASESSANSQCLVADNRREFSGVWPGQVTAALPLG